MVSQCGFGEKESAPPTPHTLAFGTVWFSVCSHKLMQDFIMLHHAITETQMFIVGRNFDEAIIWVL